MHHEGHLYSIQFLQIVPFLYAFCTIICLVCRSGIYYHIAELSSQVLSTGVRKIIETLKNLEESFGMFGNQNVKLPTVAMFLSMAFLMGELFRTPSPNILKKCAPLTVRIDIQS